MLWIMIIINQWLHKNCEIWKFSEIFNKFGNFINILIKEKFTNV